MKRESPAFRHGECQRGEKYITLRTEFGSVNILSAEDILLDRLGAYEWTNRKDDYIWAKTMFEMMLKAGKPLDIEYLKKEAKERDSAKALNKMLEEAYYPIQNDKTELDGFEER